MLSRYAQVLTRNGVNAVFHELHPDPVFCTIDQWNSLVAGKFNINPELERQLSDRKILISGCCEDDEEFEIASRKLTRKLDQPVILYLMTAQGCNLNCSYCPVPEIGKKYGEVLLSKKDALAGIDLWQSHINDDYDENLEYFVIFYGGEPLLNKGVIKQSLDYIKLKKVNGSLPKKTSVMIATNGILIDQYVIDMCLEHSVMVAVGLDGPKKINDIHKVDLFNQGTFDRIINSISMLTKAGVRTFASVSITPENVNEISKYGDFLRSIGVEKFGFNFLRGKLSQDIVGKDNLDSYYQMASRGILDQIKDVNNQVNEYQLEKKQNAFNSKDFFPVDCTCYGNQLVIQPDGEISNCPFSKSMLGKVTEVSNSFRISKSSVVTEWRKRLPLYHPGQAKALSGGGCAWGVNELKGDPLASDDSSTIFSEEVLYEFIWSEYDKLHSK